MSSTLQHGSTASSTRRYEEDVAAWAADTALAIRQGRWQDVDFAAVAEEIESVGISEKHTLRSALKILLLHLLKQRYQPGKASLSWQRSIVNSRLRINQVVEESPSLLALCHSESEVMGKAYRDARRLAPLETGLPLHTFPATMPFTEQELWGTVADES